MIESINKFKNVHFGVKLNICVFSRILPNGHDWKLPVKTI